MRVRAEGRPDGGLAPIASFRLAQQCLLAWDISAGATRPRNAAFMSRGGRIALSGNHSTHVYTKNFELSAFSAEDRVTRRHLRDGFWAWSRWATTEEGGVTECG